MRAPADPPAENGESRPLYFAISLHYQRETATENVLQSRLFRPLLAHKSATKFCGFRKSPPAAYAPPVASGTAPARQCAWPVAVGGVTPSGKELHPIADGYATHRIPKCGSGWTARAYGVLEKVKRARAILDNRRSACRSPAGVFLIGNPGRFPEALRENAGWIRNPPRVPI